jgi:hypothetical protein
VAKIVDRNHAAAFDSREGQAATFDCAVDLLAGPIDKLCGLANGQHYRAGLLARPFREVQFKILSSGC